MKHLLILLTGLFSVLSSQQALASDDREQISQVMQCFSKWDIDGGTAAEAEKCISPDVRYQRNDKGEIKAYTPDLNWKGKGKEALEAHLLDINVYNDMAVVTVLNRYNPGVDERHFVKTFILYKLKQGWRITNVVWGKRTPEK